jgi:hypothetical protein
MNQNKLMDYDLYRGIEKTLRFGNISDGIILNDIVSEYIKSDKSFSCIRLGNCENYIFNCLYNNLPITSRWHFEIMATTSGVYPNDEQYYHKYYKSEITKCIQNCDFFGWLFFTLEEQSEKVSEQLLKDKICYTDVGVIDPCVLAVKYENPWTQYLKGKKVLVVSSMPQTILSQWEKIDKVWGDKVNKIAPFELVDVIKSPHPPEIEGGTLYNGENEMKDWMDVKKYFEEQMDEYDYDIVLAGCGAWAPCVANYAKSKGKTGITLCGNIQLLFGIAGTRWTENEEGFKEFHQCYNEHWCFPHEDDIPLNIALHKKHEGGRGYWN